MNNKLFKISISFDSKSDAPVRVRMTDIETGHKEEIRGTLKNIKSHVYQALERWHQEGRGALNTDVCEYYATYADYEAKRIATQEER